MTDTIAALDPGRDKCGFAVLSKTGDTLFQKIIETLCLENEIKDAREKFKFNTLVMGNGTTSKIAKSRIETFFDDLSIKVIDEYNTTQMAKGEYFKANPPKGLMKLIPLSMQTPPVPVDDYVAVILGKRFLCNF